jgi:hypothetical protein
LRGRRLEAAVRRWRVLSGISREWALLSSLLLLLGKMALLGDVRLLSELHEDLVEGAQQSGQR